MTTDSTPRQEVFDRIDRLDLRAIARVLRFSPAGCDLLNAALPYHTYLMARFSSLGGWSPGLSKEVGWG